MSGKKKKDELEQYKDITVADMNVEGMPWYRPGPKAEGDAAPLTPSGEHADASVKETIKIMLRALGMSLLAGCLIVGIFFLILLFYVAVWLR